MADVCATCNGSRWVVFDGYGNEHHARCPDCRPRRRARTSPSREDEIRSRALADRDDEIRSALMAMIVYAKAYASLYYWSDDASRTWLRINEAEALTTRLFPQSPVTGEK